MSIEISATYRCINCHIKYDADEVMLSCDSCVEKEISSHINEGINHLLSSCDRLLDGDGSIGFKNSYDKEMFFKGVKSGIEDAIFWFLDYFNKTEEAEQFSKQLKKININVAFDEDVENKYSSKIVDKS